MKYSFTEPGCSSCPFLNEIKHGYLSTRYCANFPRKRQKRFTTADPKIKAPKWCPKRLSPLKCRIYGFANEEGMLSARLMGLHTHEKKQPHYMFPLAHHYKLRHEQAISLTAREFFQRSKHEIIEDLLPDANLEFGEVIEIDNGLRPYFFYYHSSCRIIPVGMFDTERIQK